MIYNAHFRQWALENSLDISHNQGSEYFNSRAARIAYFKFIGAIE